MSPWPHHYDSDAGGIRHAKRRAVADRTALDAGTGSKSGGCAMWLLGTAAGLIGGAGIFAGWLFAVTS